MSAHVYPAQLRSELCALPPEAFDTSLDALFLSPMGGEKREEKRVRDRKLKDKRQTSRVRKKKSDSMTEGELLFIAEED